MSKNTSRKKQAKLKRKHRRIKLIKKTILAGLFLGITASLCKAMLLHGLSLKSDSIKPVLTVHDYTAEYGAGANPLPQTLDADEEITAASVKASSSNAGNTVFEYAGHIISDTNASGNRQFLEDAEVEAKLAELAMQNDDIAEIYAQRAHYPEALLTALATNQEMTEFVKGYLTADKTVTGGISEEEIAQNFPLFIQWDTRWGYAPYGKKSNIGISGCGPTCMSMVIFALTRDQSATPDALSAFSVENGYYMEGEGTTWLFMKDAAKEYGLTSNELGLDEAVIRQYLDNGRPIICAMRPGDFTTTGHFIVIYGYDEEGLLINDPNSRERSSRHWSFDAIKWQIRNLWGYSIGNIK